MKLFQPRVHGALDYIYGLMLLLAPSIFDFSSTPTSICYTIAIVHLMMSICTRYPMGLFKLIPFPVHGGVELLMSVLLVLFPWLSGFAPEDAARNFFVFSGLLLFGVWATTDYREEIADHATIRDEITLRRAG